jgi:protein involved in polysaccharide export with SLBB domain
MRRITILLLILSLSALRVFGEDPAQTVTVSGGVRNPGLLPWKAGLTLTSAIDAAGGFGDFASTWHLRVIRNGKVLGVYSLKELDKYPAKDSKLLPGDQVVIPD